MFFKRFMRVLLSRTFAFALLALLQIGLLVWLIWWFASVGVAAYAVLTVISVLVLMLVLEKDDLNPAYKLMWVMIMALLPVFGAVFYIIWGHRVVPRRLRGMLAEIDTRTEAALVQNEAVLREAQALPPQAAQNVRYLLNWAHAPVYRAEGTEFYSLGEDFFPRFLDAIRGAKKYVFMEYHIFEEGLMLDSTMDILRQKAAEGVDVRLLWDGFGSLFTLPPGYAKKLAGWGIKGLPFAPLEATVHVSDYAMLNHRDHRKITVVDGEVGFSGGLNFADEYINAKERFGQWKDTSFMVRGEAVFALTATFLRGWDYAAKSVSRLEDYVSAPYKPDAGPEDGYVQPYCDTPLDAENVSENAYMNIIRHAKEYVYISTPYLILDNEMITSLTLAAKSGVDVRILTPGIPDKPTIFTITQGYYPVLLKGGVRIFEYSPGFNHAKMYVSDDETAIIGSANMDYRSLYLHFENCVAFYGGSMVQATKKDMLDAFEMSHEVTLEETCKTSFWRRCIQVAAKFFAPML